MLWSRLRVAAAAVLDGSRPTLEDIAGADSNGHLGNYDAIVAHFGPAGVRAMYLQRAGLLGGPLAVVFHGYDMSECALLRTYRQGYGDLFTHAAELLPISDLWRSRLIEWGAPAERVTVLRMGVDPERLPMMDPERLLHRPLRVLSVARLVEKKGLVHAIEGVMRAAGPIHYQLIGAGPLLDELASVAARAPPDKEIVFLGQRPEQEVIAALAEADVFLLPSVTAASGDMEGIPVALMEAMARGVLVVATRHSGIPELIVDQRSGWLVPERDSAAIAQVLSLVGGGACRPGEMRRAARAAVESGFNNAKLDRQLAEICLKMREARKS